MQLDLQVDPAHLRRAEHPGETGGLDLLVENDRALCKIAVLYQDEAVGSTGAITPDSTPSMR
jgi:hypothetical protein